MHDSCYDCAAAADTAAESGGGDVANAVSQLQEIVQSCSSFSPHTRILTWDFEKQLEDDTALQFRAIVSFMFNSIPHKFSGGWQSSKKKAQRDSAERVLLYLQKTFELGSPSAALTAGTASAAQQRPAVDEGAAAELRSRQRAAAHPGFLPEGALQELWAEFEGRSAALAAAAGSVEAGSGSAAEPAVPSSTLKWKYEEDAQGAAGEHLRALVTFSINGVPHHFAGGWFSCAERARADCAGRVLWYFGKSTDFIPIDRPAQPAAPSTGWTPPMQKSSLAVASSPASPSTAPASPSAGAAVSSPVEDKTILMQVQNSLQKSLAKETSPGQQVWVWSYEADHLDPQMFRAHVEVAGWGKTFSGEWCRGKKLAKRSACLMVKAVLEQQQDWAESR